MHTGTTKVKVSGPHNLPCIVLCRSVPLLNQGTSSKSASPRQQMQRVRSNSGSFQQPDSPAAIHHTHIHARHTALASTSTEPETADHTAEKGTPGTNGHSLNGASKDSMVSGEGRKGSFLSRRKWKVMGLDPSPELVAISMGECPPKNHAIYVHHRVLVCV